MGLEHSHICMHAYIPSMYMLFVQAIHIFKTKYIDLTWSNVLYIFKLVPSPQNSCKHSQVTDICKFIQSFISPCEVYPHTFLSHCSPPRPLLLNQSKLQSGFPHIVVCSDLKLKSNISLGKEQAENCSAQAQAKRKYGQVCCLAREIDLLRNCTLSNN